MNSHKLGASQHEVVNRFIRHVGEKDPRRAVEKFCDELRKERLGKEEPPFQTEAYEYAAALGVKVFENSLESSGLVTFCNGKFIIEVNEDDPPERKSYSVCHELAHIELRRCAGKLMDKDAGAILTEAYATRKEEWMAEVFAANLLMPREVLLRKAGVMKRNTTSLLMLARTFKTSVEAMLKRICDIEAWDCFAMRCEPVRMQDGWWGVLVCDTWKTGCLRYASIDKGTYLRWDGAADLVLHAHERGQCTAGPITIDGYGRYVLSAMSYKCDDSTVLALITTQKEYDRTE